MKVFDESDRLNHDFGLESVVLDIGAHEGWFTEQLWNKFRCYIYAFEPIKQFRSKCEARFIGNRKIVVFPYALGANDRSSSMGVKGDMTGEFCVDPNDRSGVQVVDVLRAINMLGLHEIQLATINCEGGEYEILERLIDTDAIKRFLNISVQFHTVVPDYQARMDRIIDRLNKTHDHVYGSPFIWDGFTLRQ